MRAINISNGHSGIIDQITPKILDAAAATNFVFTWPTALSCRTYRPGRHQMDAYVRRYIHENLRYRFVILPDAASAYEIEAVIKSDGWPYGRPLLNPGK